MANRKTRRSKEYKTDQRNYDILNQMHMDAFLIAINELFHVGKGRVTECAATYQETFMAIVDAMNSGLDYAQAKVDTRLQSIVPDDLFVPWPDRYHTKE